MKKRLLLLILLLIPFSVKAENLTYNEAVSAVKQTILIEMDVKENI